jgi:hypothetical protein
MLRTALGPAIARFLEDPHVVAAPAFAISKLIGGDASTPVAIISSPSHLPCGFQFPRLVLQRLQFSVIVYRFPHYRVLSRWQVVDTVRIVAQTVDRSIVAEAVWHGLVHPEIFSRDGALICRSDVRLSAHLNSHDAMLS